jgi:hypothetical protein
MSKEQIIREALALPTTAIDYHVSQYLADKFPEKVLVEGNDGLFNVETYARAGHCSLEMQTFIHDQVVTHWYGREISSSVPHMIGQFGGMTVTIRGELSEEEEISDLAKNAWFTVQWKDNTLDILVMHWSEGFGRVVYTYWILCDSHQIAKEFIKEVCRWNAELRGEVLVFSGGCWKPGSPQSL